MKTLNTYTVTMHDTRKRAIHKRIVACVSASAACRVANILYSFDEYDRWVWDATYAFQRQTI